MTFKRFLHSEFFTSEDIISLTIEARYLFLGLFGRIADDEGRGKAGPVYLRAEVFPADGYTVEQVKKMRDCLHEHGLIRVYLDERGDSIFDIPSWRTWQRPKYVKPSKFPEFNGQANLAQIGPKRATGRDGLGRDGLEVQPAVAPAPAGARKVSGDDGEVLRAFDRRHRATLEMPYLSQVGRDRRCLRPPLKVYGKPLLLEMVEAFFNAIGRAQRGESDAYVGKARPDIPNFVRTIPALIRDYSFDCQPRVKDAK